MSGPSYPKEARQESESFLEAGGRKASESPRQLTAEPTGLPGSLPWHLLGGVTLKFSASTAGPGIMSHPGSTLACVLSEQVQELGNHFTPTFEYFIS